MFDFTKTKPHNCWRALASMHSRSARCQLHFCAAPIIRLYIHRMEQPWYDAPLTYGNAALPLQIGGGGVCQDA